MKSKQFVTICKNAVKVNSVYMLGGLLNEKLTNEYITYKENQFPWNKNRDTVLRSHLGWYASDCICFIKSILWGWTPENPGKMKYKSNNVPDIGCDQAFELCTEKSSDFTKIIPGEFVWQKGHIGVYVGDGLAVECVYTHDDGIQYSACNCQHPLHWTRNWTQHGKSPWIDYSDYQPSNPNVPISDAEKEKKDMTNFKTQINEKITLKKGDKGDFVKAMQQILINKGFSCGASGADGSFGGDTLKAVKEYQTMLNKQVGANLTVDGVVGIDTLTWLIK